MTAEVASFLATAVAGAAPTPAVRIVRLASATDFAGFRRACRQLWSEQVAPDRVVWQSADDAEGELFDNERQAAPARAAEATSAPPPVQVPAAFLPMAESAILHSDPERFGLLYRLLWRLQLEPALRADPLDPDWQRADAMAQAVRRDLHDVKATLRWRTLRDRAGAPVQVAWFAPEHHVVAAVAPFFAERFAATPWAILTPARSVCWDRATLRFGPGVRRDQAPGTDADEQQWFALCESIFERSLDMIARGPTDPERRPATEPRPTPGHVETPGGEAPKTLSALNEALQRCHECPIGDHATQAVGGEGRKHARLMFVGEQPGDQEDLQGRPFVGPAGQLLARALEELGVPRNQVYITNAVKHFKFELRGKRRIHKTPAQQEAAACLHWLESEIALVDPAALVALGATAARQLMGTTVSVLRERGRWLVRNDGRRVLITLHPSALLRMDPADKAAAYAAWLADLRHAAEHFAAAAP